MVTREIIEKRLFECNPEMDYNSLLSKEVKKKFEEWGIDSINGVIFDLDDRKYFFPEDVCLEVYSDTYCLANPIEFDQYFTASLHSYFDTSLKEDDREILYDFDEYFDIDSELETIKDIGLSSEGYVTICELVELCKHERSSAEELIEKLNYVVAKLHEYLRKV